ncbi:type IV toxin-antitoxin system AbiEi family antitoxin domain-containing protein [Microbacterium panaciterrae]|uniref:type IV toxin-antitoxin system AbiEi family antitoxin domain-containing protein n=1 Tax=Microbacterium panaciterrae TaxID=985759 RepID=UPI0031E7D9BC
MISLPPDPVEFVTAHGGVVRVARLKDEGVGRRAVDRAVRDGLLTRVRRGWVACPDADPVLVAAARNGVVITCVSQAKRLKLWLHETPTAFHVGADPKATGHRSDRAQCTGSRRSCPGIRMPWRIRSRTCWPRSRSANRSNERSRRGNRRSTRDSWRSTVSRGFRGSRPHAASSRRRRRSPTPGWRPICGRGCGG